MISTDPERPQEKRISSPGESWNIAIRLQLRKKTSLVWLFRSISAAPIYDFYVHGAHNLHSELLYSSNSLNDKVASWTINPSDNTWCAIMCTFRPGVTPQNRKFNRLCLLFFSHRNSFVQVQWQINTLNFILPLCTYYHQVFLQTYLLLRGAWTDRDTNNIFAHCSLIFYFLDFKFSNFVCPSEVNVLICFFFFIPSGKRKISKKPPKTP